MKVSTSFIIGLASIPLISATAQRQEPSINVSGFAEVRVAPDEVDLNVGVETRHESLNEAKRQNDERVSSALEFLKKNGVKDKDVKTDYIAVEPVYLSADVDPNTGLPRPNREQHKAITEPLYYVVRKSIGIRLTQVSTFDAIMTGLITNGVNHVQGVDFRTTELRRHKDKAREMAIQAAKEKADAMASALGIKVGKPISINVNDSGGWASWQRGGWGYSAGGGGGGAQNVVQNLGGHAEAGETFSVGQLAISAEVTVSFSLK